MTSELIRMILACIGCMLAGGLMVFGVMSGLLLPRREEKTQKRLGTEKGRGYNPALRINENEGRW